MNCKNCIHKPMCKYSEDFTNTDKKLNEITAEAVKDLPFKTELSITFNCSLFAENLPEVPFTEIKKEPVKRKRRTKAEIEADKKSDAKAEPEKDSEPELANEMNIPEEKKAEPVATPEETFKEIKEEKEKPVSVTKDTDKKQELLDMDLKSMLDLNTPEDKVKAILSTGMKLVKDVYNPELVKKLDNESIEHINKNLKLFHLETI